uniref:Retrotransposon gag domain-containing protein n=1 Tax=Cajanus cajan TaxID=3821 RepID=A0A151UGQ1_CAJCA
MAEASASQPFLPHMFSSSISTKLSDDNFLIWFEHAESTIKGHKLKQHIVGVDSIPQEFLSKEDATKNRINPLFENFEQQDSLLKSWMLESMEPSFKIRVAGCTWCYQIWSVLKTYFASQTKARVKQIKIQLRNVCKTRPMSHYLLQIKQLTKTLAAIGSPVSSEEHIDFIFDGLPEEYDPLETSCLTRSEPYTVPEIEALLLHQEERLEQKQFRQILPKTPECKKGEDQILSEEEVLVADKIEEGVVL